jgi:hypothetical protein
MVDWQFEAAGRSCALSGDKFKPGDRVGSLLYLDRDGLVARLDYLCGVEDEPQLPERRLARWEWKVRERLDEKGEARARVANAEEFFLSLFDEDGEEAIGEEMREQKDLLRYLFGLLLERRKVLKLSHPAAHGDPSVTYLHPASGRTFTVRTVEVSPGAVARAETHLEGFLR